MFELATVDQDALWKAHREATRAQATYDKERAAHEDGGDPEIDSDLEIAHRRVVDCQAEVDKRTRPGILGAALLVAGGVLAALTISPILTVVMVVAAAALGEWLIVLPRKALAAAEREEEASLVHAEADSWLGVHLRRIDDVMQPADRRSLAVALDQRTTTKRAWDQISGGVSLEAAGERETAIRDYAAATDTRHRKATERVALDALAQATDEEAAARRALLADLDPFGLTLDSTTEFEVTQLRGVARAADRGRTLRPPGRRAPAPDGHGHHVGCPARPPPARPGLRRRRPGGSPGTGPSRRSKPPADAATPTRTPAARDELEAEIAPALPRCRAPPPHDLGPHPRPHRRPHPSGRAHGRPSGPGRQDRGPAPPDLTDHRAPGRRGRASGSVRWSTSRRPWPTVRRRSAAAWPTASPAPAGSAPTRRRCRCVIDDALFDVEPDELFKLLDMVVRLSDRTQIVLLSSDPTIAKWARREAAHGIITLFEADGIVVN